MKKFLSLLLAVTMIAAMLVIPVAAEDTVNYEEEFKFTKEAPNVDGKVSEGEYGTLPIHTYPEDKNQFVDVYNDYAESDWDFEFYGVWDNDYIYMAWVIEAADHFGMPEQDFSGDGSWDEGDYGYMWMYSDVQFILTPGAPAKGVTNYQTSAWAGDYLEVGLALTAENNPIRIAWSKPVNSPRLDPNEWDAAIVRDDAKKTTTYEVKIPWSNTGVDEIGNGAQFGFTYAVASQEYEVKPGMIEWQDGVLGGKMADNAAVITLTGAPEEGEETKVTVEEKMLEALGTAFDDAKVDYVIEAPETYKAGDEITVKVYARNITAANGIHLTEFKLYYDNTKLLLTNDIDEENENILVCVEKAPKAWGENFSRVNNDYNEDNEEGTEVKPLNDGVIIASIFTDKTTASSAVKEDDQVIFAFTFKVLDDAEGELGFVIPHAESEAALNTKNGNEVYTANGDYAITHATVVLKGKAPTCTEDGLTEGLYCPDCGKIIVEQEVIPALGHTDGEWDTTLEPTCTEAGSKDLHCAVCDDVIKTEEIAALGHDDGEWVTTVEPTEDKGGVAERRCTRCDEVLETKELPPLRLLGDVDGNKEINKYDYLMVKRAVMETITLDDIQSKAADVDRKGSVDKFDYLLIKRHVMETYKIEGTI